MKKVLYGMMLLFQLMISAGVGAEEILETQLNRGIRNSPPYSYVLLGQALEASENRRALLEKATSLSPDMPAVFFAAAKKNFSVSGSRVLDSVDYLLSGIDAYSRNFLATFTISAALYFSFVLSFLLAIVLMVIIVSVADLRLLSHDTREGNLNPVFLIIPVLLALLSPLLCVGALLVLLGLYMRKVDRILVYGFLGFLVLSPVAVRTGAFFVNGLASGPLRAVSEVNTSGGNGYAVSVLRNSENPIERLSYGIALKREGRFQDAVEALKEGIGKNADPKEFITLGNAYVGLYGFAEDRKSYLNSALNAYQESVKLRPFASAYYNLSQVSRELLDYPGGNEYFSSALSQNRNAVAEYSALSVRNANRFVVDELLSPGELWKYARERVSAAGTFGLVSGPLAGLSIAGLLLIAWFAVLSSRMKKKAYRCRKCGAVLCPNCDKRLAWGQLCPQCFASLMKPEGLDMRERVSRLLEIHKSQSRRRAFLKLLSFLLPGAPQVYAGKLLSGFLWIWPFLFFLTLPFMEAVLAPDRFFPNTVLRIASLLGATIFYAAANILTRERIAKGWL